MRDSGTLGTGMCEIFFTFDLGFGLIRYMQASETAKIVDIDGAGQYREVRSYTERLCEPLKTEDYIPQPIVDVSPARWNIAHTTWFFEEMILKKFVSDYKVFDESFGFLFNSYYNTIGERTPRDNRGALSRPTVTEIFAYRKYVDEKMFELLSQSEPPAIAGGLTHPGTQLAEMRSPVNAVLNSAHLQPPATAGGSDLSNLVILALNHEQQHQELLLTDLKYTFSINPLFPAYRKGFVPEEQSEPPAIAGGLTDPITTTGEPNAQLATDLNPANLQPPATAGGSDWIELHGGIHEIGHTGDGFCFDNELSRHKVYLNDFAISKRLTTNGEFLEFIDAGGYRDHRFWHSEGWDWVNQNGIDSPLYWHTTDGERSHLTLGGLRKLPLDAPVCHVSYYEAAAFAEWKGMRLPTEFEWEAANERFNWGKRWEWTNSAYLPYPGFAKAAGAVGEYNGKFMINQMVLRGASVVTPEGHSRPSYRNFFHPHLRWQFTGIRLAR